MAVLRERRIALGLTQHELNKKLRADKNYVHRVETGYRALSFLEFHPYAKALGVDPLVLHEEILKR